MTHSYTFFFFFLKQEELSLYHRNNRLELGLKGYKLLVALVENHNRLVPKDDLIASAWDNQIVTDGTLSKQIERIRQALSEYHPDEVFIETVRGIGYKFIPTVKEFKDKENELRKWKKTIISVSLIPLIVLLYFYPFGTNQQSEQNLPNKPFNLAVIPSVQGDEFIKIGGISYLSNLLDKNPQILSLSPQSTWFTQTDKQKVAIELQDSKQLDYILLVDLTEIDDKKITQLQLKNYKDIDIKKEITTSDYKALFSQTNNWVREQLKINKQDTNSDFNRNLSDDSFALESFLRGLKESTNRNYSKAIDYFQTAINQDSAFDLAWIRMAEAQILSSDYNSASAILDVLSVKNVQDEELNLWIQSLKANVLVYSEQSSEAEALIESALILADKLKNTKITEKLLYLQATIFLQKSEFDKAIDSTLKQRKLLEKNNNDKSRISRVDNNLGYLYNYAKDYINAEKYIRLALTDFEKDNHISGMFSSYITLAGTLYQQAKFEQEELYINKAEGLLDLVENKRLTLAFYETKAYLQIEIGKHTELSETISEIEKLSLELKTDEPQILALGVKLELATRKSDIEKIKLLIPVVDEFAEKIKTTQPIIQTQMLFKLIDSTLLTDDKELTDRYFSELKTISEEQTNWSEEIQYLQALISLERGNIEEVQNLLQTLLSDSLQKKHHLNALKYSKKILELAVKNSDFAEVEKNLNQISHLNPTIYPFARYKAQLAAHKKDYFKAASLMQELRNTSNEWWNIEDQLLLESYLNEVKKQ